MKTGIIGAGLVGATAAYALTMRGVGREIVLVDIDHARAEAEADDIRHAVPFSHPLIVRSGEYADLAGSHLVVICAGVSQKPGETRLDLLGRNEAVFRAVIPAVLKAAPDAILLIATNPVDVMTHVATRIACEHGCDPERVLGTGTTLDTARFRSLLARHLGVDSPHVHAYVLGEHGDSEVLTWSLVTVAGMPLADYCRLRGCSVDDEVRARIDDQVRRAAYRIIAGKGSTYYGVGSAIARIAQVILGGQRSVLTVCAPSADIDDIPEVTISLPRLVGGTGVLATMMPPMSPQEKQALHDSAAVVAEAITGLSARS